LEELISMESNPRTQRPCVCNRDTPAVYRCMDCDHSNVRCQACILDSHRQLSLHRIEEWKEGHFARKTLFDLGHVLYLGHDGVPCPELTQTAPRTAEEISIAHVHGIHPVRLRYCVCVGGPSHVCQLLRAGFVPGTPNRPETAYSIDVLALFHTLNMESGINMYDFHKSLVRRTDNVFRQDVPDRYAQFRVAMRFWRELQADLQSGRFLGLPDHLPEHLGSTLAYLCPACPQPGLNFFPSEGLDGPDYIHTLFLAVDGNFRLQLKKKVRDDQHDFHLHDGEAYFRNEEEYKEYLAEAKDYRQVRPTTCHSFEAGSVAQAGRYKNAVVSGVVAVYCARHGFFRPDSIVDLSKGEKYMNSDYALAGALAG
ncbi:hypothetical protein BOTBODRAFT_95750, partial [Botryobasidium botryosum FD-172 SS1]